MGYETNSGLSPPPEKVKFTAIGVLFDGLAVPLLMLVGQIVVASGWREKADVFATKLHKTGIWPLTELGFYQETHKLDVANLLALLLTVVVWMSWEMVTADVANEREPKTGRVLLWGAALVVLLAETILFYFGLAMTGNYGGSPASIAAVTTAMWTGLLIFVAAKSNELHGRIKR